MGLEKKQLVEIVGTVSVVLSLLFVGFELRQNTNLARFEAYNETSSRAQELTIQAAADEELSAILVKLRAGASLEDLTPLETEQYINMSYAAVKSWEGMYRAVQTGILPESYMSTVGSGVFLNNNAFREIWNAGNYARQFSADFVEWFELQSWNN